MAAAGILVVAVVALLVHPYLVQVAVAAVVLEAVAAARLAAVVVLVLTVVAAAVLQAVPAVISVAVSLLRNLPLDLSMSGYCDRNYIRELLRSVPPGVNDRSNRRPAPGCGQP